MRNKKPYESDDDKRELIFLPYKMTERILSGIFRTLIAAFLPYINHLCIRKTK